MIRPVVGGPHYLFLTTMNVNCVVSGRNRVEDGAKTEGFGLPQLHGFGFITLAKKGTESS
jgi:hypothetical protein